MTTATAVIIVLASTTYYGDELAGELTASGEVFDPTGFTCATWLYPLGTELIVRWEDKEVIVVVNDRCDHRTDLDLSRRAFEHIAKLDAGRILAEVVFDIDSQTQEWRNSYGEGINPIEL